MVDAHCHLNFKVFENDVDEVIKKAFEKGVKAIINVGAQLDTSKRAVELAGKYENLYATVGIHPHHADELEQNWETKLEELAKNKKVVAIGECGLDYYRYEKNGITDIELQKELFIKQIEIAHKLKLPLMIHNRCAGKNIIDILVNHQLASRSRSLFINPPGMFHCFSGDIEVLKFALQMGFYVGFDGNITYKGLAKGETTALSELAKFTPLNRIIVETDSPYLTPEPHRGSRNEPSYVIIVAEKIAQIKNVSFGEIEKQTTENANFLFKLNTRY